jgi:hypothetical protein
MIDNVNLKECYYRFNVTNQTYRVVKIMIYISIYGLLYLTIAI